MDRYQNQHQIDTSLEVHRFMLPRRRRDNNPVEVMIDLREGLEEIPEYTETYKIKQENGSNHGRAILSDHESAAVHREMVLLAGSWRVPPTVLGSTKDRGSLYVNPNAPDNVKRRYSGAAVRCACGTSMIRTQRWDDGRRAHGENVHADDCDVWDRLRAQADVAERRAMIFREQLWLGNTLREVMPRAGVGRDSPGELLQRYNIDSERLREKGYEARHRTWTLLQQSGETYKRIAAAYDRHPSYVRRRVREFRNEHGEPDANDYYAKNEQPN